MKSLSKAVAALCLVTVGLAVSAQQKSLAQANLTIYRLECAGKPNVECFEIPGHGIDIVFWNGPASIRTLGTYSGSAPNCSVGETSASSVFVHTSSMNLNDGVGYIGVSCCISSDGSTADLYDDGQTPYTSYSAWHAALP